MNAVLAAVLGYVSLQLLFGFLVSRRIRTEQDYLVAGRSLGPWLATFTIFATWFGAESCIGAAGQAYSEGLAGTAADPFGYALGIVVVGALFAIPLYRRGIVTLADLFRQRYGSGVERAAAVLMIPTSLLWAAAQIRAFGQVLAASSELGVLVAITVAAAVVIVYTSVGGMLADAFSDLVQGLVLVAGLVTIAVLFALDGGGARLAAVPTESWALVPRDAHWIDVLETFAVPVCGSIVAQELIARVVSVRSPELARRATVGAGLMYLCVGLIPVSLGLAAAGELDLADPEHVVLGWAQIHLPQLLYVLFVGALVSAILSTVDSALLVAGSLAAHNLVLPLRPDLSESGRLRANRIAVVAFGVTAWLLALSAEGVYALVIEASSLGSAGILVLVFASLWLPRLGGPAAAYAALAAGIGVYLLAGALDWRAPYLSSLAAAWGAYLVLSPLGAPRPATATGS